jgi:hypothetical protein
MRKSFNHPILIFLGAVGLQGLWRFGLEPLAQTYLGISLGNFLYVFLRVVVMFALPMLLAWGCRYVRFQALSATAFATFIESVGYPTIQVWQDLKNSPADMAPAGPGPALLGLTVTYMFNLPIVLIIAFAGFELGKRLGLIDVRSSADGAGQNSA